MTKLKVPKVWDLLNYFKDSCHKRGWKTSDPEDIIQVEDEYHTFIGTRTTHPSTFRRIASNTRSAIVEGDSYRTIDVSYTAWVFQQKPPQHLVEMLAGDSELLQKNAIYDLSNVYQGKLLCLRLNKTKSVAFSEFERFLIESYGVRMKPLYEPQRPEPKTFKEKLLGASIG